MQRRSFLKLVGGAGVGVALSGCATPVRKTVAGMPYRMLGRTGLEVSVVAYGGLTLFHGTQEEGTASLRRAFDQAVNYFDVAPAYGNGDAEVKMGIGLQGLPRDRYVLANKTKKRDAAGAREELERSLVRLKTDHFDVYQFHCFIRPAEVDQVCGPGGALETVLKARAEGKVRVYDKGAFRKGEVTYGDFQYKLHSGDILIPRLDMREPLQDECAHFAACVRDGAQPLTDGYNGLRVLQVLTAGQRSLERGGDIVDVEPV